jgi:hypothetical protein
LRKYAGEARLDYHPTENTQLISTAGYSLIGSAREITTTFGAAQVKDWSYTNLQERLHYKQLFAQVFYDKSNSGNSSGTDPNGTYYLRTGIPVVDRSSILAGQIQQGMQYGRTRAVIGGEYLATRPQTEGTIDGRNESRDDINEYGGYLQTTTSLLPKLDFLAAARVAARGTDLQARFEQHLPRHLQPRLQLADVVLVLPRSVLGADTGSRIACADHRQSAERRLELCAIVSGRRGREPVHAVAVHPWSAGARVRRCGVSRTHGCASLDRTGTPLELHQKRSGTPAAARIVESGRTNSSWPAPDRCPAVDRIVRPQYEDARRWRNRLRSAQCRLLKHMGSGLQGLPRQPTQFFRGRVVPKAAS